MEFKIFDYRSGKEYPSIYEDGKPELYIKHVRIMEERHGISLPEIRKVFIGDSENPMTEIQFENGLMLYDEEVSPWMKDHNKKIIAILKGEN